ncbi:hypothetical protein LPB19_01315 [Marinobacter salinisoli]|uniref:Uncharacterized protein n=1 Tax=Marinobacter salinisoli TaxID=2769486 RepID=A0ABX7MUG8_9GAMM|nr:hypothetical protein [Marinobacter salinisoli]QSP95090.1 hypothetical protein LPB19_01315 [Marinobacter salinisoli]
MTRILSAVTLAFLLATPVYSEPFAEWGYLSSDGVERIKVTDLEPGMQMPSKKAVGFALMPETVALGVFPARGDTSDCAITLRTQRGVKETCEFYKTEFEVKGIKFEEVNHPEYCSYFASGEYVPGVVVSSMDGLDGLYSINGVTQIDLNFESQTAYRCD